MNYFRAYWFTEINWQPQEVDILIANEDMNRARMIASWYITNSSHFEEYPLEISEFGAPTFMINHEWEEIQIISSISTIKEAFKCLTDIGMEITSVDSIITPLKPNLQHMIWGMLRKEFGISNDNPFTKKVEEDEATNGELTTTQLIKITDLITHILQDAKELYVRVKGIIGGDSFTLFTRAIEQLQQTLEQWQIFVAKEQTKKLISTMEKIEWEFIEYERARDHKVQSQITIPNLNTILAHNQRVTAHKLYEVQSAENHKVEQRYQTLYLGILQKTVLYFKWIFHEAKSIVGKNSTIIAFFVKKIEYTLIFISMIIMIILQLQWNRMYWGNTLYVIGIIGISMQWYNLIHIKNNYIKFWVVTVLIAATGIAGYVCASNLALI